MTGNLICPAVRSEEYMKYIDQPPEPHERSAERSVPVPIIIERCDGQREYGEDLVVKELPVTIYINGEELSTVVCSPWDVRELAVGFLKSEGILKSALDLKSMVVDMEKGTAHAEIQGYERNPAGKAFMKRYVGSCCGRSRTGFYYAADALLCRVNDSKTTVTPEEIFAISDALENHSDLFHATGGVHNAALAAHGEIIIFQEDVGRHNTLDKILGRCVLDDIDPAGKCIVFSGRVSSEIVLKVSKMGVCILISCAPPTELALSLAEDLGITVIGFARGGRFSIYTHDCRVSRETSYR